MGRFDRSTKSLRRLTTALLAAGVVGAGCFLSPDPYPGEHSATGGAGGGGTGGAGNSGGSGGSSSGGSGGTGGSGGSGGGDVLWAISPGGAGTQEAYDVAVDSEGNVLVAGRFEGTFSIGPATFTSSGFDGFVLKLSPEGELLWVKQLGGDGNQAVSGVEVDDVGNVYLTGSFSVTILIDATTLDTQDADDVDFFVAKLAPDGDLAWASDHGTAGGGAGSNDQVALGIAVNGEDDVAITGWFNGAVEYEDATGTVTPINSNGNRDIFVAGIGAGGLMRWFAGFGDNKAQVGRKIALGNAVYIIGDGLGKFNVGSKELNLGDNDADIIAAALTPMAGDPSWAFHFLTDYSAARGLDIALVAGGDLLLTGYYNGSLDLGGGALLPSMAPSRFVTRRSSAGLHIWSKGFAAPTSSPDGSEVRIGIAADADENVLLAGEFSGSVDFGGGPLTAAGTGTGDIYVAKLDPDGDHLWSRRFGDGQPQFAYAVAADPTGHAVITGNFLGEIDFDGTVVTANNSGADLTLFVAKLAP